MVNAKTTDIRFTQPVVYEFKDIKVPALLIIGTGDRTTTSRERVKDKSVRDNWGSISCWERVPRKIFRKRSLWSSIT
jgi:hypothetical protein